MSDVQYQTGEDLASRWDIYGPVHKGLRLAHATMTVRLGATDWSQLDAKVLSDLREHIGTLARHLAHEEAYIHPALQSRDPGAVSMLAEDHERHRARFVVLAAQIDALEKASHADRPQLGRALYLGYTQLVAEDLAHMHEEETVVWPCLCAHFDDAELREIEMRIIGELEPQQVIEFMRLMIPAMSRPERAALLVEMKSGAPAEAFAAVLEMAARQTLSHSDFADLEARLPA